MREILKDIQAAGRMRRMKEGDESHAGTLTTAAARAELIDQWYAAPHLHLRNGDAKAAPACKRDTDQQSPAHLASAKVPPYLMVRTLGPSVAGPGRDLPQRTRKNEVNCVGIKNLIERENSWCHTFSKFNKMVDPWSD